MIGREEVERLLSVGNESQSFEVKGPGSLGEAAFLAKIARAAMAMGNRRDGGVVCIGIDEVQMEEMKPGLDPLQSAEWSDFDNVAAALAKYADPAVVFELAVFELVSGALVAVLDVAEFDVVPHVCKRSYPKVLQDGMTYVRPRGKPESVPVPNSAEMRALLDVATAKGVREWVRVGSQAGVQLTVAQSQEQVDAEAYEAERVAAWSDPSATVQGILESGHFDISVRPTQYMSGRVLPADLTSFVANNSVRLRGWPVPFVDYSMTFQMAHTVGQDLEAQGVSVHEAWRFCSSGQFLQRRVLVSDLRDGEKFRTEDPRASGAVIVWDVLLYLVEVVEFGARLATALEVPSVTFDMGVRGIGGRELVAGDPRRRLHSTYMTSANVLEASASVSSSRLLSEPRVVGVEFAQQIFGQFGARIPDNSLLDYQAKYLDPE